MIKKRTEDKQIVKGFEGYFYDRNRNVLTRAYNGHRLLPDSFGRYLLKIKGKHHRLTSDDLMDLTEYDQNVRTGVLTNEEKLEQRAEITIDINSGMSVDDIRLKHKVCAGKVYKIIHVLDRCKR